MLLMLLLYERNQKALVVVQLLYHIYEKADITSQFIDPVQTQALLNITKHATCPV